MAIKQYNIDTAGTETFLDSNGTITQLSADTKVGLSQIISTLQNRVVYPDLSFSGTSNNATTYLQGLIDAASAAYNSALGRIRIAFPTAVWMVDGLVWKSNVWYDWGDAIIRKRSTGASPFNRLIGTPTRAQTNGSYYGQSDNIKSTGGRFEVNGFSCPNGVFVVDEGRNCEFSGFVVVHSAGAADWAAQFSGRNIKIINPTVLNTAPELYQDGLHLKYGNNINVIGGYIESGDDAIALGWDISGASQQYDDEALEDCTVVGTVVNSAYGAAVKVYYGVDIPGIGGSNRRKVRRCSVLGITGRSGQQRNGGVTIIDDTSTWATRNNIEDIQVQAAMRVGSTTHSGVNAFGFQISTGNRIDVDLTVDLTDTVGGVTRFRPFVIQNVDGLNLKFKQKGKVELPSQVVPNQTGMVATNVNISKSEIYAGSVAGVYGITLNTAGTATIGKVTITDSIIRDITDGAYGVFTVGPAASMDSVVLNNVNFEKATGATSARGYATNASGIVNSFVSINCDYTKMFAFSVSAFDANHTTYSLIGNRGVLNRTKVAATVIASGAAPTLDCLGGPQFTHTVTVAPTFAAPTNVPPAGNTITVVLTQNATGGFNVSWNAAYIFPVAWSNTGNTANKKSTVTFISDGTALVALNANSWY